MVNFDQKFVVTPSVLHEPTHDSPRASKHICLVDYGNYPFLFEMASHWPSRLGRLSYIFGTAQLGRNTAAANSKQFSSGGVVREVAIRRTASADNFIARHRMESEAAWSTVRQLEMLNPELVIGANNPLSVQVRIAKWCRRKRKPFIFWLQDLRGAAVKSILQKRNPLLGKISGHYFTSVEHRLLRQSAHVISIAEEFCPEVRRAGVPQTSISTVPNWAPIARLPLRPHDNAWSSQAGLADKRVVLYTGNLGMKHNPSLLLAFCEAVKERREIAVATVAEGVGATWLKKEAEKRGLTNLHSFPFVNADVLPDVLGTAEVLVSLLEPDASKYSVPSKTWTYLCAGKPLVMAMPHENQAARIVMKIGAGVCCSPGDEAGFVRTCLQVLEGSAEQRAFMGSQGRRFAEENFDLSTICARVARCVDCAFEWKGDSI